MAKEKPEERSARLHHKSEDQKKRLANETAESRQARLEKYKQARSYRESLPSSREFKSKMNKFHHEMSELETPTCSVCFEKFPGTKMASHSTECHRFFCDKKSPKFFSLENNMNPGTVPWN